MKLNVKSFSLTSAIFLGLSVFLMTWWIIMFEGVSTDPTVLGRIYRGYKITPLGSLIGLVWGLGDGLVGGAIFAAIYNLFSKAERQ